MSEHLILIRHSVPDIEPVLSSNQWSLSQSGRHYALSLARHLVSYGLNIVFSSMEPKAIETARIIANYFNLPVECVAGLHEHEREQVPFVSEDNFRKSVFHLLSHPDQLTFGQETADEAHRRFKKAVDQLSVLYPDQSVAIVSHGTVMSLYVARLLGADPITIWLSLGLPSALIFSRSDLTLRARIQPL